MTMKETLQETKSNEVEAIWEGGLYGKWLWVIATVISNYHEYHDANHDNCSRWIANIIDAEDI